MDIINTHTHFLRIMLMSICMMPVLLYSQNAVKHITNADGLSNNSVNCILEDSKHMLWVGTWGGLNAYNGRDFKTYSYDKDEPYSISNNVIWQIIEQNDSTLWISTDYGINRWERSTKRFTPFYLGTENHQPRYDRAYQIDITSSGRMVCFVKEAGLFYYDDSKGEFSAVRKSKLPANVRKFCIDNHDNVVFLTEEGEILIYSLSVGGHGELLLFVRQLEYEGHASALYIAGKHIVVEGENRLSVFDDYKMQAHVDLPDSKKVSQVISRGDELLVSFVEGGCMVYNMSNGNIEDLAGLPDKISIFTIYAGSQNILWIGTDGQGILEMYEHNSSFNTIKTNYPVRCFCEEENGNMLAGTKGEGILLIDKERLEAGVYLTMADGLISNSVYTLYKNMSGDIFIGTEGEGLNYIMRNGNDVRKLEIPERYPHFKSVYGILSTNNDSVMWLGTAGDGLVRLDLVRSERGYKVSGVKKYKSPGLSSPSHNIIYSVVPGHNPGELWIGTRGGGVNRFDIATERFHLLEEMPGRLELTNNDVLYMIRGDSSSIWIGTGYGLNRLFPEGGNPRIMEYTTATGLANNTIHGILKDENQNIWASTSRGISYIDMVTGKITNYTSLDGLQNDEFSDGAVFKDKSGRLYFGGVSGLNCFDSDKIRLRDHVATLNLDYLKINNTIRNIHERINNSVLNLSYDEPYVTLGFSVYEFINNENCEFAYRIIGYADDWIYNGNTSNIVLTKLPPGEYVLEVKGTNGDRVWSDNVYSLRLNAAYPWWLGDVAFSVYFLLVVITVYMVQSIIRNRIRLNRQILLDRIEKQNLQRIHESKLDFFTNVAHEFFTPLTLIYGPAQHLLEKSDLDSYTKKYIYMIKNNADRMQKLINELMEFRKAEAGHTAIYAEDIDIRLLVGYVSDNYAEIAEENKIDFSFSCSNVAHFVTDRNSLEKIVFNLVSNAFKYTPSKGYIRADINTDANGSLHFSIRNSGKGLTDMQMKDVFSRFKIFENSGLKSSVSTGVGLNLTKSLAELLGGEITVNSILGEYVEFEVVLPSMRIDEMEENRRSLGQTCVDETLFAPKQKDISILIVEDEKNIRELLKDIMSPYYKVREAADGEEALKEVEQKQPDIIICDVLMPKMDGITFTKALKSDERTAHIPVIHISAKKSLEDQINAYDHGADLYIPKPFHPRYVLSAVENIVNKYSLMKEYFKSGRSSLVVREGITMHKDDELLLDKIVKFIEDNIEDESLNPDSIADFMGVSKAGLYRKLKELTGKTPSEFVRNIRLTHAADLLRTTKMTVSEIMYKSGFSNKSYFYREFAKIYNVAPKEYRNSQT